MQLALTTKFEKACF